MFSMSINREIHRLINVFTSKTLTPSIEESFSRVSHLIGNSPGFTELKKSNVNIIFTDQTDLRFDISNFGDGQAKEGFWTKIIVYNLSRLTEVPPFHQQVIIAEELVHHFWNESDERTVKKVVADILPEWSVYEDNGVMKYRM